MTDYYENQAEYSARGIDYDLCACMEYNDIDGLHPSQIEKVLAVWEGENDGDDWRWVILLKDNRYAFIQGGCDFTGWDCQSYGIIAYADTPENAAAFDIAESDVYNSLMAQLTEGKNKTWHEKTSDEMSDNEQAQE